MPKPVLASQAKVELFSSLLPVPAQGALGVPGDGLASLG